MFFLKNVTYYKLNATIKFGKSCTITYDMKMTNIINDYHSYILQKRYHIDQCMVFLNGVELSVIVNYAKNYSSTQSSI